jgi:hypothetical protein
VLYPCRHAPSPYFPVTSHWIFSSFTPSRRTLQRLFSHPLHIGHVSAGDVTRDVQSDKYCLRWATFRVSTQMRHDLWWQDRRNGSVPVFRAQFAGYCGCCHAFNLKKPWWLGAVTFTREFTSYIAISYVVASHSFISQCYQNLSLLQSVPPKSSVISTLGSNVCSIQPCAYGCKMYNLTCVWEIKSMSHITFGTQISKITLP